MSARLHWTGVVALLGAATLWELAVAGGLVTLQFLPPPSEVARATVELVASGALPAAVRHTVVVTLVGWLVAVGVGTLAGLLLGLSPTARRWSGTSIDAARAVPPVLLVPVALLLFGFDVRMELLVVVYAGVWPPLVATAGGVGGVPAELLDVARTLRLSRAATVRRVVLPAAVPDVLVGARLSLTTCLVLAVVAEMLGNPAGLGNGIIRASQGLQPAAMLAHVVATGLLGIALDAAARSLVGRAPGGGAVS